MATHDPRGQRGRSQGRRKSKSRAFNTQAHRRRKAETPQEQWSRWRWGRKRAKKLSQGAGGKNRTISASGSNPRPTWNPELNGRFMDAIRGMGNEVVVAVNMQEAINEPNVTLQRVADSLQVRHHRTEVQFLAGIAVPLSLTERTIQLREAYRPNESGESVAGCLPSILQPSLGPSAANTADCNPRILDFGAERVDQHLSQTSNWKQFVNTSTPTDGFASTQFYIAAAPNSNTFNTEGHLTGLAIEVDMLQGMTQGQVSTAGASSEMFASLGGLNRSSNLAASANTEDQSLMFEPSLDANNSNLPSFDEFNVDEIFHQV
ncbi:hypothetical protein Ancab_008546 [Ancistrocladus abbreviatus]